MSVLRIVSRRNEDHTVSIFPYPQRRDHRSRIVRVQVDSLGGFDNLIDDDDHDITDSPLPGRLPILRGSQNSNSKESSKETSSSLWPPMIVPDEFQRGRTSE